jgi:putative ABC transport system permease protein
MYRIALKMLMEDKAKFIGMILALSFSAIIITQQMAIFFGIMRRTYSLIMDTNQAQIWIMNPSVKMIDDINPIRLIDLYRIRSIEGVEWAVPFYKGLIRSKLPNGQFQMCELYGIDSATFIGAPHTMIEGNIINLRTPNSIIIDTIGAEDKLAQYQGPGKPKRPLRVGDTIELNDRRALVVGICKSTRTFTTNPIIYTTFDRALYYAPFERKRLAFILATANNTISPEKLCKKINTITGLQAYTRKEFEQKTINYYLKSTGIPINFGIAVILGILIGAAITGQIFFNFTSDNLKYLALFTIVGASKQILARITLLQATWIAFLGWGIGSGVASFIGLITQKTQLAFYLPWQLFLGTGFLMWIICIISSLISINRIFNIQLSSLVK